MYVLGMYGQNVEDILLHLFFFLKKILRTFYDIY